MDCLLPELVDPRHPKKKLIRDPEYVSNQTKSTTYPTTHRKHKLQSDENGPDSTEPQVVSSASPKTKVRFLSILK